MTSPVQIEAKDLTMAYGTNVIMRSLNFQITKGEIVVIMGGSGCGKSTLLKHLVGLREPAEGEIFYEGTSFTRATSAERQKRLRSFGILYQSGALWGSMSLADNIALPLAQYTSLSETRIRRVASYKLALVGLKGFEDFYPAEISGGMRKRAGLARAMALDPDFLFFDEPSAGLDPISSRRLDDLILQLRDSLETTIVIVTHELASIFAIADRCLYLDVETKQLIADGPPQELAADQSNPTVYQFLRRGEPETALESTPAP
ncbi:MAG: ATP-binding cassette domain-containing protein [Verrucomicrobiota bacterium]